MEHTSYQLKTRPLASPRAVIQGPCYRFSVLTSRLIRMEYQQDGRFTDLPTQVVLDRDFPVPGFRVMEDDNRLEIVTDHLHLYYDKKPFRKSGLRVQLHGGYATYGSIWHYGDTVHDLGGTARTLDEADGPIPLGPGLMSRDGFTVLDDSRSALLREDGWVEGREVPCRDLYFFGYGHDYLPCLKDFYHLCGATPLLPRFTLGNWWSRYYPYTEQTYLTLMDRFREKEIPLSTAVIDMDWHLTRLPEKYGSGWTGYTWNPDYFPDPKRFLDALHRRGLHVTLNVHPADGVRAHEKAYPAMAKALGVDAAHEDKIPFAPTDRAFMDAYFQYLHHPHEAIGVDFWWIDWQQGEDSALENVDPLWLLNHQHFLDSGRDGRQPLTFSRYAGIGSHRYPIGFSGDTVTTWESLDFQPYFTATASNVGYSWWSHDIGGHMKGCRDDELTTRWVQFGVFSPIMRLHSTCNPFYGKEPWNYNAEAEAVMTNFLRLRHAMIPYLYTWNYLTHLEGRPLVQPIYYRHDTPQAYQVPNEYYFGDMIVCPITRRRDPETLLAPFAAWLPEGLYFDFFTGKRYLGGRSIQLYRDLSTIPVLIQAGSILPMDTDILRSHLCNPKELEVLVYHGGDGEFTLYEDDGEGHEARTRFTYASEAARLEIALTGEVSRVVPPQRCYRVRLKGVSPAGPTEANGGTVLEQSYDPEEKVLTVLLRPASDVLSLRFPLESNETAEPDIQELLFRLLNRAQISFAQKQEVFSLVQREPDTARCLSQMLTLGLTESLYGAVAELLTAF